MNSKTLIVFPNQLFEALPNDINKIIIIEDELFFGDYKYHKKKLLLHRASMKYYFDYAKKKKLNVKYYDFEKNVLKKCLETTASDDLVFYQPFNHNLENRIKTFCKKLKIKFNLIKNPMLIKSESEYKEFFDSKKHLSMNSFYISQRKEYNILCDNGKPVGGQWSFDQDNRLKLNSTIKIPPIIKIRTNKYIEEAKKYINKNFTDNLGKIDNFNYPVTHDDARVWLNDFIKNRLAKFGDFEDAIDQNKCYLFHSILSAPLNIGLLTPMKIIENVIKQKNIPINSLEGFVRQILGWREFMGGVYYYRSREISQANFWRFDKTIPNSFYSASTGLFPIDNVLKNVFKNAYAHHIERLMILGNFMLLCEIKPKDVYQWFMELFIDAYDWVMEPNIYAMSQYAEGGTITTKPYISSSNYILKMSNYSKGDWCEIWDGLYWRFIKRNQKIFHANPRMKIMSIQIDKMDPAKLNKHCKIANEYLKGLK